MIALTVVVAATLIALGVVAAATRRIERTRAIAAGIAGLALLLVAIGMTATASVGDRVTADAAGPVAIAASAVAIAGLGRATGSGVLAALGAGPGVAVLADPFSDPECRTECYANPFALAPDPTAAHGVHVVASIGLAAALAVAIATSRRRATACALMSLPAIGAAAMAFGLPVAAALPWPVLAAVGAGAALSVDLVAAASRRGRLADLTEAIAWDGDAETALRRVAQEVRVGYRVSGRDGLVDRSGQPFAEQADGIDIVGPAGLIAHLENVDALGEKRAVARLIRGPARLGLENLRLAAQGLVDATDIASSARRVVEDADRQRRRLERDLHDGAQHGLLNLGLAVRIAADQGLLPDATATSVVQQLRATVAEVREIGHGMYSSALDQGGLDHALQLLATRSPVPLTVLATPDRPLGAAAAAVYAAVEQVVYADRWSAGGAATVEVSVDADPKGLHLTLKVDDDAPNLDRATDRFRALGGTLTTSRTPEGDTISGWLPWSTD